MIPASRRAGGGLLALLLGSALLTACTGSTQPSPVPPPPRSAPRPTTPPPPPTPTRSALPVPTAETPSSLPASPDVRLAPVESSPKDLARVDIRNGSPRKRSASATLRAAKGFTVSAACVGAAGTLIHWSVVAKRGNAFLFGSSAPCNGAFLTDAGLVEVRAATAARLEVTIDDGVAEATVVLRRAEG